MIRVSYSVDPCVPVLFVSFSAFTTEQGGFCLLPDSARRGRLVVRPAHNPLPPFSIKQKRSKYEDEYLK